VTYIWIFLIVLAVIFLMRKQTSKFNITPADLKARLDQQESLTLIDVRDPDEFHGPLGHIENAICCPLNQMKSWVGTLRDNPEPVILICHVGNRSLMAARFLSARGIPVMNLEGGMTAWDRYGFPVIKVKE
jgi:rhodanese-related sulfurtransferase